MLGFTCQAVRGFPTFAPCLEHVCAGGGGGSVAIVGLVLVYLMGLYITPLMLCYLYNVMGGRDVWHVLSWGDV